MSALFVLILSVTGAILATEPLFKSHQIDGLESLSLEVAISNLKEKHVEILSVKRSDQDQIIAQLTDEEFNMVDAYIDPFTGDSIALIEDQPKLYSWTTALHRSLFLKTTGRVLVAITTLALLLILTTGIFLFAQRQGGFKMWFSSVKEGSLSERWHVILSRWFMLPIYVITLTGILLSSDTLGLIEQSPVELNWSAELPETTQPSFFKETRLSEIKEVTFPFSEDPIDYYHIKLDDREVLVEQINGQIVDEVIYSRSAGLLNLSRSWHTGNNHQIWAIILGLSSLATVFFLVTGLVIYFRRKKNAKILFTPAAPEHSEIMIYYGSEKGYVFQQAQAFALSLQEVGEKTLLKVGLAPLDDFEIHESYKQIVVMTSTYGDGDPPSNAQKFESVFQSLESKQTNYSVVAFGSSIYPKFCAFGKIVDQLLAEQGFQRQLPVALIDEEKDPEQTFGKWSTQWSAQTGYDVGIVTTQKRKLLPLKNFTVIERTALNVDDTFLLKLKPSSKINFQSGDLLQIQVEGSDKRREYSIAKVDNDILLSVKMHDYGLCSRYMSKLQEGEILKASLSVNEHFHFPKSASKVILIANGTGVAPFLGMLDENSKAVPRSLFLGLRFRESVNIYQSHLSKALEKNSLSQLKIAYSRADESQYVQDLLKENQHDVAAQIKAGAHIMICGSLAMKNDVLKVLDDIAVNHNLADTPQLEKQGRLRSDCY
ncbi:hypothetical protein BST97_13905 [Nonlabens spongiae]|uniref:NADPH--hemoprotein reductase n=2 Tax=Nonlabens spongiae TaxID=331648 RepID=A0A1W6MN12_9FLAO|nr:hypothetical protein BST97_13905 [Nonlabens spongiae]